MYVYTKWSPKMSVVTQISGNIHPGNTPLSALKSMLTLIGIHVTHPSRDESLFYKANSHTAWQLYDTELTFYSSIAKSPFHIIYNDDAIDKEVGLQIAYAMLKDRPILMTGAPALAESLSLFTREVITKHIHSFHAVDLPNLELTELSKLLVKLKPTDYSLSKSEKILINAQVKTHFRNLVEEAKRSPLTRSTHLTQPVQKS